MKNKEEINSLVLAEERTLLAAERTFSAWLRTALSAMAGGLAILRFISFKSETHRIAAHILGEMLIFWGCLLVILASLDYRTIRNKLLLAKSYKTTHLGFLVIVLPLLIMSALLIVVTLP